MKVIDIRAAEPDFSFLESANAETSKIIIGESPTSSNASALQLDNLPPNITELFPALTHLYLWKIEGLSEIPELPGDLKCLEIRACPDLKSIANIPLNLETLILEDCPNLQSLPDFSESKFDSMFELSLNGCAGVSPDWINRTLESVPNLKFLDLSKCTQLKSIDSWPTEFLDRIELNDCPNLEFLPYEWPENLRRLGLRKSACVNLDSLPESMDYLDLQYNQAMLKLPQLPPGLRTLFLFGSRIQMPPASEHGDEESVNVAEETLEYFQDIHDFGKGDVKRCKLLMLGNGAAGKTCLSQCLENNLRAIEERPVTTHGVQFWDWKIRAPVNQQNRDVQLHIWDFGGQEIYHNTHRLFVSKGTVFTLVWNPAQDDPKYQSDQSDGSNYVDQVRPLQYWLDYIHLACARDIPRIALVCSHHHQETDVLDEQWKSQISEEYHDRIKPFYIDSYKDPNSKTEHKIGDINRYHDWLKRNVGEVVQQQGSVVPSYWEIAQNMVEEWLPKVNIQDSQREQPKYKQLQLDEFHTFTSDRIEELTAGENVRKNYTKLSAAVKDGGFELSQRRTERILRFLTRSGWLYWDEKLFEQRVIVGQRWALDAIYTLLDRNEEVYGRLVAKRGRFTRDELNELGWSRFERPERELLLTYLQTTGICFELVSQDASLYDRAVYVSFQHLPNVAQDGMSRLFHERAENPVSEQFEAPLLHQFHWQQILTDLGRQFGVDARYASDGFFLQSNKERQSILIEMELYQNRPGFSRRTIGGEFQISVSGPDSKAALQSMKKYVLRFVPNSTTTVSSSKSHTGSDHPAGQKAGLKKVFFSYKREPEPDGSSEPLGYEEPVDAIYQELWKYQNVVILMRDEQLKDGADIVAFMEQATSSDHLLVFHSEGYWKSHYCMFELISMKNSLLKRQKTLDDVTIWIELPDSGIWNPAQKKKYESLWTETFEFADTMLESAGLTIEQLRSGVIDCLWNAMPEVRKLVNRNQEWTPREENREVIEWVKQRVGISSEAP